MTIKLRGFGDRVMLAAGEDAHTGSHKLDELLDRIDQGLEPSLTRVEMNSLRKRQRGRSEKRAYYASLTDNAVALYRELRAQDPSRSENETIKIVIAEMAHLRTFDRRTIKNALHRSRHWGRKRTAN